MAIHFKLLKGCATIHSLPFWLAHCQQLFCLTLKPYSILKHTPLEVSPSNPTFPGHRTGCTSQLTLNEWLAFFFLEITSSRTTIQPGDGFKLFSSPRTAGLGGWTLDASRPPIGWTKGLLIVHLWIDAVDVIPLSTFLGTVFGRTIGISYPQVSLLGQPSKLVLLIRVYMRGVSDL